MAVFVAALPVTSAWAAPAELAPARTGVRAFVGRSIEKVKDTLSTTKPKMAVATSTLAQKGWLAAHLVLSTVTAVQVGGDVHSWWQIPVALTMAVVGYHAFDPLSGLGHHELDNYHQQRRGYLGYLARYFQHHHADSMDVIIRDGKRRAFADLVQTTAPVTPFALALMTEWSATPGASPEHQALHIGLKAAAWGIAQGGLLSVAAHAYAHTNVKNIPRPAQLAQKLGLFITGRKHGEHHHDPYGHGYGIQTGALNEALDQIGFYRWKERVRYQLTGAVPNSWRGEKGKEIMMAAMGREVDLPPLVIPDDVGPSDR